MDNNLKARAGLNAVFLIREGLAQLRMNIQQLNADPLTAITNVIREADQLSQTCKKLERYVEDAPQEMVTNNVPPRLQNVHRMDQILTAILDGSTCDTCGGILR